MAGKKAAGIDNTARRVWDKNEYTEKARDRDHQQAQLTDNPGLDARKRKRLELDPLHQGLIIQRANLKARDFQLDLAANLHRTQVVSAAAPLSAQAGFYCNVCDVLLKDSHAYLDHLNGKWHNRALGMSMKVDKSTTEQVRARLQDAKRKKDLGILGSNTEVAVEDRLHYHLPDGMSRAEVEKEGFQEEGEDEQEDEKGDMAAMMGFSGFCGGKND